MASKEKDTRTAEQIRQNLNAARSRVSQTVEDATQQFHPKTLKNDAVDDAKSFAQRRFDQAKGQVKDENGWRGDRLILVGGVVVGGLVLLTAARAIVGKATGATTRRKLEKQQLKNAKRAAKESKAARKAAAKRNRHRGKKDVAQVVDLNGGESKFSSLAESLLRQASVLRAEAAAENKD